MRNIFIAFSSLVVGILVSQVGVLKGAQSTTGQVKCDYTYLHDEGKPNIGEDGAIKYHDEWKKVTEDGWILKVAVAGEGVYVFEKCR